MTNWLEKAGLIESETPPAPKAAPTAAPAPVILQGTPMNTAGLLSTEDQARLKTLEAQVYATPSSYVIFQKLRASRPADATSSIFSILEIANPGVTPAKVLADIETHLGVIAAKRQEFEAQIAKAKADRIDGPNQKLQQMMAQIAELQKQVDLMTPTIRVAMSSLDEAQTRFKAVEDQLSAPLLQAKQLITPLT